MSIQTEIDRIISLVGDSYAKVKAKGGTATAPYLLADLPGAIESIPEGVELPTLTNPGKASDMLSGKQLIGQDGSVVTGNIPTKTASNLSASGARVTVPAGYYASQVTKDVTTATQATPSISVNSSGLITASATQTAGYVYSGNKSATKQLTTLAAQTITPGTSNKFITPGKYIIGNQTILGDSNLKAENIKSGVSIFGVAGNYEGSGGGSGGGNTVSVTTTNGAIACGFDANGNPISIHNSTAEFLDGIVYLPYANSQILSGSYVKAPDHAPVFRFSTPGHVQLTTGSGGGA